MRKLLSLFLLLMALPAQAEVLNRSMDVPRFRQLPNYDDLHPANMSRAFTEFEAAP
jgi:hypothetical protein